MVFYILGAHDHDMYIKILIGWIGTHVAGIIMAQENELGFTGVATGVDLGMYKVSGCPGFTTSEILMGAFMKAYEDGNDIISCSAGDDSGWASDVAAEAASRIVEAGVPVVVAAGNSGGLGLWQTASPASGRGVVAIGSVDNTVLPVVMTRGEWNNGSLKNGFGWQAGSPVLSSNVSLTLWAAGKETDLGCNPLDESIVLEGKIALVQVPKSCGTDVLAQNVLARGGKHILFYPADGS